MIGNIVPWNFPFDLSVGPLVEMLAAGNRVVIKPSEHTPACAELLRRDDRTRPSRATSWTSSSAGSTLARAFTRVRWDHLLYTGSPAIGREVAKAAAEKLVPVTLELGGKCPAILTEDSIDAESVRQILGTKAIKNGQMCISVDYCLVPRERLEGFARLAGECVAETMPGYCTSESCTGIVTARHLERLQGLLQDARAQGADVRALEQADEVDPTTRQMPISLVIDPPDQLALMQEEIFGPILPVKAYDTLDEAIEHVNAGERPLALYVFAGQEAVAERRSAAHDLGRRVRELRAQSTARCHRCRSAASARAASGRHHGVEGFREFSNLRGVFIRGEGDLIDAFAPPYGPIAQAVVDAAFAGGA